MDNIGWRLPYYPVQLDIYTGDWIYGLRNRYYYLLWVYDGNKLPAGPETLSCSLCMEKTVSIYCYFNNSFWYSPVVSPAPFKSMGEQGFCTCADWFVRWANSKCGEKRISAGSLYWKISQTENCLTSPFYITLGLKPLNKESFKSPA